MFERTEIGDEILKQAEEWSTFSGNQFSIRNDSNKMITSNIAEIVFSQKYPEAIRISDTDRNADFLLKGKRVDVKCKERNVFCKKSFDVSVEARQKYYDVDWYVFYSYNIKSSELEFLGWMDKEGYYKKANLYKKGDCMDFNNWVVSVDCYNLKIKNLIRKNE